MSPTSYLTAPPRDATINLSNSPRAITQKSSQSEARKLDRRAAVHDHAQPRRAAALGGLFVVHAELHPDRPRADLDRLVDVRAGDRGAPEDVDHLDRLRHR